jgi:hypothetical protein
MADKAMTVYLNDHLAGASMGSGLADQIGARHRGSPLGEVMESIAPMIEEDRQALLDLMRRIGAPKNRLKQLSGQVAEKVSQLKFSGLLSSAPGHGAFMALETLTLGVQGKQGLWKALQAVAGEHPALAATDLAALLARADAQYASLERERVNAGIRALTER